MRTKFSLCFAIILLVLVSCQTRVVNQQKPMRDNSLELYQKYSVQTMDAKVQKVKILKVDSENIYGKKNNGEDITIKKSDIREVKKFNLLGSVGVVIIAAAAFILIPV